MDRRGDRGGRLPDGAGRGGGGSGEALCDRTAADGSYVLPRGSLPLVKIWAKGFFAKSAPAGDLPAPVILARAGTITARLVDAVSGAAVGSGDIRVVHPWGEERGPFPVAAAGVEIGSLPPGELVLVAGSLGYLEFRAGPVTLEAGRPQTLVFRLVALAPTGGDAQP